MTDQDLKGLETLREVETDWLADQLSASIANLSYPVGMGEGPTPDHARKAAETLFDRYSQMIAAINARAQAAEAEEGVDPHARFPDHTPLGMVDDDEVDLGDCRRARSLYEKLGFARPSGSALGSTNICEPGQVAPPNHSQETQ